MTRVVKVSHGNPTVTPGNYQVIAENDDYVTVFAPCGCCEEPIVDCYRIRHGDTKPTDEPASIPAFVAGQRSDGYKFLCYLDAGLHIRAGCRHFRSFAAAREHWQCTRSGTPLGNESFALLDKMEAEARKRSWLDAHS